MGLPLPSVSQLDPDTVTSTQQELAELLTEAFPQLDLTRGFVHDVNLNLAAVTNAMLRTIADQINDSQSLLLIEADPEAATDAVVDSVLSNFRVTRQIGQAATGQVTVILNALVPVIIPANAVFTAGLITFSPTQSYAVRTAQSQVTSASDLVLVAIGGGQYAFTVPVVASTPGSQGLLSRGTALVPQFTVARLVKAYAAGDFIGGTDTETNTALIQRLIGGIAAPTFSGRTNVMALLAQQQTFTPPIALSIIGAGDPEMLRDKHTIFPIAQFGRADAYIRTSLLPASASLTKTATLMAVTATGGIWQFTLLRADAPGFYEIDAINLPSDPPLTSGFVITSDLRGTDLSAGLGQVPDVIAPIESTYSAFQTTTIQFLDDRTPTTGLVPGTTTASYQVAVSVMPNIATAQTFLGARDTLAYGGDVLVKAAVPCFLQVAIEVYAPALQQTAVDIAAIQAAASSWANTAGFPGRLYVSSLISALNGLLPTGAVFGTLDLFGRIRQPDGTEVFLRDPFARKIVVPNHPATMVTSRTVTFYLDPADVTIAVYPLPGSGS